MELLDQKPGRRWFLCLRSIEYRQVFQRQYEEEYHLIHQIIQEAQVQVVEDPVALRELLFRLMDALIERSQQNPDIVRLWTRRWLEKPAQTEDIETRLSAPLYQMVESLLERARELGTIKPQSASLSMLVHSFTWLHYGYFGFGQLTFGARVSDPFHPNQATEFRQFVHHFFAQTLCFSDQCS